MSRYEFKLPDIGEGVTEGEIVEWHAKPGDTVAEDQSLVEVMTDKATVMITSPKSGRIVETLAAKGDVVKVHSTLVVYELADGTAAAAPNATEKQEGPAATAVGDIKEVLPGMGAMVATAGNGGRPPRVDPVAATVQTTPHRPSSGKALATPATRKLARDLGVELADVRPSDASGRVTKDDVRTYVASASKTQPWAMPARNDASRAEPENRVRTEPVLSRGRAPIAIASPAAARGEVLEERVPFRGLRRRIADKMQTAKNTAAHFTFVEECDCTALKVLRERLKPKAEAAGVKLSYLPLIAKAVVGALKKHPILNSALDESTEELVYRKYFNLGIAVATEQGLVVPVVKHADRRSILDIAREIDRLATAARAGKSALDDMQGSTFTITSLGAQGGLFATPIINFPEVGILGVHRIKEKPVVRDGQIVVGDVMLLSLSCDHRIIDGHVGAAFAYDIIRYLEDPDELLLDL